MAWHSNKVIWSEGLFLRPQHFQQHDRYIENLVEARLTSSCTFSWGIRSLEIDQNLLALGSFAISSCRGVFPDGTPFRIPDDAEAPAPLTVTEDLQNEKILLALPVRRAGSAETDSTEVTDPLARYVPREVTVEDSNADHRIAAELQVAEPRLRFLREGDDQSHFTCLAIARIQEARPGKGVILDEAFLPPYLDCSASTQLRSFLTELQGLLHHRGEALASRVTEANRGGVSEIADFLLLQVVNRLEPLVQHLGNLHGLHPEHLYRTALQIAGELATFTRQEKRPSAFPPYQHDDLENTFGPLVKEIRQSLSMVLEQRAIAIPLEERKYGVRVAPINDRNLLKEAQFVLAVNAQVRPELLQNHFPTQVKVGPVEHIRQLVNSALPGIALRLLPVAPRQIPYHAGHTYFALDQTGQYWRALEQSGAFGIHVAGDFPGLQLALWAIKE